MKQKVKQEIYTKHFDGDLHQIRFSDLPKDVQENDIIDIRREDAYHSENNSYEAFTQLVIIREREETDEEYQKRIKKNEFNKEIMRKNRYETFLMLKSEFEPNNSVLHNNSLI